MCLYCNTLHFLSIFNQNTYVVGTCNHTDVEKPNHPSMGPTHTHTHYPSLHIWSVPCLSSGTTDMDNNDMTAIPVSTGWHGLALSCCLAGKVRTTPFRTSTGSGQSRKQLNTRPSLATVASAVLPVHFFHNNDNQHAAWRGLCSYCRGNEGGKKGFNNSAMIGRESELWTGWLNNNPQDSNPRPHRRGSVVWTNYAMPYPLCI